MLRLSSALKDQKGAKKATCETLISFFFLKTSFKYRCLKFVCVCVCVCVCVFKQDWGLCLRLNVATLALRWNPLVGWYSSLLRGLWVLEAQWPFSQERPFLSPWVPFDQEFTPGLPSKHSMPFFLQGKLKRTGFRLKSSYLLSFKLKIRVPKIKGVCLCFIFWYFSPP